MATKYSEHDMVAIKRTQLGPGLKVHHRFLGPYLIKRVLHNNRYSVEKVGDHEGPQSTTTSADHLKQWSKDEIEISDSEVDSEDLD